MAARLENADAEITDLRQSKSSDLSAVLEEELGAWRRELHWDFSPAAGLICRYTDMRALAGVALRIDRRVAGYAYHVIEEGKALLGNLYTLRPFATPEAEHRLIAASLNDAFRHHGVNRMEAQLMMLRHPPQHGRLARQFTGLTGSSFPRLFMLAHRPAMQNSLDAPAGIRLDHWTDEYADDAARLITSAYDGHIDSRINDQYLHAAGARRFLSNIVLYPGCGAFLTSGSFVALDRETSQLLGLSLASVVAPETGHITQICVLPNAQHRGLGGYLLSRSLEGLWEAGCREASLTVTAENGDAIRLYRRFGFGVLREFSAHVWLMPQDRPIIAA